VSLPFTVDPLPGQTGFGAVVTGLRFADLGTADVRAALLDIFLDKGVVVFRGMDGGARAHVALSEIFGELEMHPLFKDIPGQHPTLIDLRFRKDEQEIYEVNGELRGGWLPWHSDLVYTDRINRGGILRPIQISPHGGETGFIDQIAAWEALPRALKTRCEGLNILYRADFDPTHQKFGAQGGARMVQDSQRFRRLGLQERPRVIHPLVYVQAETGRRVLNLSPWFADGIEGMESEAGDALLAEIAQRVTRPELAYYHRWKMDEMVLWDNWRMIHCATGVPVDETRHMQRTTIAGDYALGRIERPAVNPTAMSAIPHDSVLTAQI
jgi:taurine dioxygenase